eukprot:2586611-Ditylum_brightwellii.AAC.1
MHQVASTQQHQQHINAAVPHPNAQNKSDGMSPSIPVTQQLSVYSLFCGPGAVILGGPNLK